MRWRPAELAQMATEGIIWAVGPLFRVSRMTLLAVAMFVAVSALGTACNSGSNDAPSAGDVVLVATKAFLRPLNDSEARATAEVVEERARLSTGRPVTVRWWDDRYRHLIVSGLNADESQNDDLQQLLTAPGRIQLEADPQILMPSYASAFDAVEASSAIRVSAPGGPDVVAGRVEYLFGGLPQRPIIAGPVLLEDATESGDLARHVAPPGRATWPPEDAVSRELNPLLQLLHQRVPVGTEGAATTAWLLSRYPRAAVLVRRPAMMARPSAPTTVTVEVGIRNPARRQLSDGLPEPEPAALGTTSGRIFLLRDRRIVSSAIVVPAGPLPSDPRIDRGLRRTLLFENVARDDWDDIEAVHESGPLPADVTLALLP